MTYEASQKSIIAQHFSNKADVTTPILTTAQFKQQYGNGYKVFTSQSVRQAIKDLDNTLQKGIGDEKNIKSLIEEINSCDKVYVTNGTITNVLLVKAFTSEEIEKAQKSDLEKGNAENIEEEDEEEDPDSDLKKSKKDKVKKSEDDDSEDDE